MSAPVFDGRLQRRVSMHVRRDAAQRLSNGRVVYDALFTRTGYQTYPRADGSVSVEYRPPSEVFHADSLASLGSLPGVLLHPSVNFGTKFDAASYPVRGCTGERVVPHTDQIHTAGTLCVWDDEWNAAIESDQIAELSAGYTIIPGPGGTGPDGTKFDVMHTGIVGDHMAGVPAGNAGTARVVTDVAGWHRATRSALADMAAARMDARPYYHDLGRTEWPARETPTMDEQPETPAAPAPIESEKPKTDAALALKAMSQIIALADKATPQAVADVWIDIMGSTDDPDMRRVCAALGVAKSASVTDSTPDAARFDAAVADAAAVRADLLELAHRAIGQDYASRVDGPIGKDGKPTKIPKTDAAIKREIIAKIDASRLARVDAYQDALQRGVALDMQLAEVRAIVDARKTKAAELLAEIERTRKDKAAAPPTDPAEVAMIDALAKRDAAAMHVHGYPQTQPTAQR